MQEMKGEQNRRKSFVASHFKMSKTDRHDIQNILEFQKYSQKLRIRRNNPENIGSCDEF